PSMREANVDGDAMLRNPMTGFVGCCAVAASGKAAAEPAIILMNSRRLIAVPASSGASSYLLRPANRKGAMSALGQKQTGALQKSMSALPQKADMSSAQAHVCFRPIADIAPTSDEHSDARQNNADFGELARARIHLD